MEGAPLLRTEHDLRRVNTLIRGGDLRARARERLPIRPAFGRRSDPHWRGPTPTHLGTPRHSVRALSHPIPSPPLYFICFPLLVK